MKKFDRIGTACELAKALGKPVLYISFSITEVVISGDAYPMTAESVDAFEEKYGNDPYGEICKAAPYLDYQEDMQIFGDEEAFIVCDDYKELRRLYWQTVGDDGPTESNPYDGPARVYALTINSQGEPENENT